MPKHAGSKSRSAVAGEPRPTKPLTSRGTPDMQDPFAEADDLLMSRATDIPSSDPASTRSATATAAAPAPTATVPAGKLVCPFCGSVNDRPTLDYENTACPRCTMADTPATRQATRARLGPWFVRQNRNPAAPGMKFDTLMALVKRGQVTAQSVVRGPTTNQFWRFAAQVKGLSREFGVCYNCATPIDKSATICPQCNRMQEPPANPDVLLENAPTASASSASSTSSSSATVHREIKTPPPAPAPSAPAQSPAPALAPATVAVATADEVTKAIFPSAPPRVATPARREREPSPAAREAISSRTELLAPPTSRTRPAPKPHRTVDDGILSARDLATAFQLDFTPNPRPRRGGTRRAVLVMALLAISAGAIVLIANQDYRDKARAWFGEKTSAVRGMVTGRSSLPPVPHENAPVETAAAAAPDVQPAAPATQPSPEVVPAPVVAKAAPETRSAVPDTKPVAPAAQITIAPAPRTDPPAAQRTQPRDATPPAKDAPVAKVTAAPVDAAEASKQALVLWRGALDAEARRDYAKAVENYEAIKKLPKSTWPAGLEINLTLAKKHVK